MTQLNFDARRVQPFDHEIGQTMPVSDENGHPVIIYKSQMSGTKDGQGAYLALHLKIIDGPHKGRSGVYRLNLRNQSPQAVEIAEQQLSAICHVTGQLIIQTSEQLHNVPFRVLVRPQAGENADKYTEIYGVLDINGNKPGVGNVQPQTNTQMPMPPNPVPTGSQIPTWANNPPQEQPQQEYPTAEQTPPWAQSAQQEPDELPPWQRNK